MKALKPATLVFLFSLLQVGLKAQSGLSPTYIDVSSFKDSVLLRNCLVLIDSGNNISPRDALERNWKPLHQVIAKGPVPSELVTKKAYLRLDIANPVATPD